MGMLVGLCVMSPIDAVPPSPLSNYNRHRFVIGLAGWSGSGKTTLAEKLIAELTSRDIEIATIKHAHHNFDADIPGKDSHRHRSAGANQVLVSSTKRSVLFTEHAPSKAPTLDHLLGALRPCDIVIVEGFKEEPIPKIEIYRSIADNPLLYPGDNWVIAIASDSELPETDAGASRPAPHHLDLNDIPAIANFICGLAGYSGAAAGVG